MDHLRPQARWRLEERCFSRLLLENILTITRVEMAAVVEDEEVKVGEEEVMVVMERMGVRAEQEDMDQDLALIS